MPQQQRSVEQILSANGYFPTDAFAFVQRGLGFTVDRLGRSGRPEGERHVTGQELCLGLRDLALVEWGFLARTVLAHMNIRRTGDFGKIVYYMIDNHLMQKRPEDSIEHFQNVFDFAASFDKNYRIEIPEPKAD